MINKLQLFFDTVRCMRPGQICSMIARPVLSKRAYHIGTEAAETIVQHARERSAVAVPPIDEDPAFLSRFSYLEIREHRFTFLHESHRVDLQTWHADASPLWVFNLHYFEYGLFLAQRWNADADEEAYETFKELVSTWIAATRPEDPSWHPYPSSLRIVNWLICVSAFGERLKSDREFYRDMLISLYRQYRTLRLRQETWLLANHYFENLFAITAASDFFCEDTVRDKYCRKLRLEAERQVLSDGAHFERSPMYHKIILTDLLRLRNLAAQDGFPDCSWLDPLLGKMRRAMELMDGPDGRIPLFNDSGNNVSRSSTALTAALNAFGIAAAKIAQLDCAGYYRLTVGHASVLFDGGEIGPMYMPGHGHCDCLSFELALDGKAVFVNSGTYQYQGSMRSYFRSVKAHNTVMLDGEEQSQCWGEHRVAKRIRAVRASVEENTFCGQYLSYHGRLHRRIVVMDEHTMTVSDEAENAHRAESFLHIADGYRVNDRLEIMAGNVRIASVQPLGCEAKIFRDGELTRYAPNFGELRTGTCIRFQWSAEDTGTHGYRIHY